MPVEYLSVEQEARYGRFAAEPSPGELEQFFRLDSEALGRARARRRPATRLGWAVQWGTVRMLGTFLTEDPAAVPAGVVRFVAEQLAKHLRDERPDYAYLKAVFRALRGELGVEVQREPKTLPYVPGEDEIRRYYQAVWQARRTGDMVLIKTLLYTGVRVAELVAIRLDDVDLDAARIRITHGKGGKDRVVPFPQTFRETLALHIADRRKTGGQFLFGSSWKKPYSTRGVRALLARYAATAGLPHNMPPHRLRHFLFTWLKTQGIDDALIQPYSGHASRQSPEIYSRLALTDAQATYENAIGHFPV